MKAFRKIMALFIIIFIILPIMFGIIWTVGITKAIISPEMFQKVPQMIISEIPDLVENSINNINSKNIYDEDTERIFNAIRNTGIPISELLNKTGISNWLNTELSDSLYRVGEVLKGNSSSDIIFLNMIPLKDAFKSKYFKDYLYNIVNNLPICNEEENKEWKQIMKKENFYNDFPLCKYAEIDKVNKYTDEKLDLAINEIPDKVKIFEVESDFPINLNVSKLVVSLSYLLFIIPLLLIILSSIIADSSKIGFIRWSGYTALASGIVPLTTGYLLKYLIKITNNIFNISTIQYGFDKILYQDIAYISSKILDYLFSPIIKISAIVIIIGIIIIAFSYILEKPEEIKG